MIKYFTLLFINLLTCYFLNSTNIPGSLNIVSCYDGQTITIDQLANKGNQSILVVGLFSYDCVTCKSLSPSLIKFANDNPSVAIWNIIGTGNIPYKGKTNSSDWFSDVELLTGLDISTNSTITRAFDSKLHISNNGSPWNKYLLDKPYPTWLVIRMNDKEIIFSGNDKDAALDFAKQSANDLALMTAIESDLLKCRFSAYPNPSNGILNFTLAEKSNKEVFIEIFNVLGGKVKTVSAPLNEKEFKVDMNDLESGLYVLKFHEGDYRRSIKITLRK